MNNKYEERLGTERMLPLIFKMALPAVAAQFVNLLYSIVDRIYIGHIPGIGTDALAGVGVTTSLIILISSFSAIVGGGGAPLAAIALGQGDRVRAGKILGNGFVLLILFTLLTSVIAYTFMEPILLFTGASENTLEYAVDYLSIYLLGTIFVEISTGLNSFINAQGRPAIAMFSVLIGALLNIILDPIFIFWFDMGVKGAALATVLSQACSAVWVVSFLFSRRASLPLEKRYMGLDRKIILSILALGVSPFIMASTGADIAYVTPSHQYPTGIVMPIGRRMELLKWAYEKDGRYIIEDDYDSEFRYKGKPIPALQGYDAEDKVIYLGTFSKSIAPAIRLSYMVLPKDILKAYRKKGSFVNSTVSKVDQTIVQHFIEEGYYERHLNKTRALYKNRHDVLIEALKPLGDICEISGEHAGVHILLTFKNGQKERNLIEKAKKADIRVYGLSDYRIRKDEKEKATILLGYANMREEDIKEAVAILNQCWRK